MDKEKKKLLKEKVRNRKESSAWSRQSGYMLAAKIIMLVLTVVFPLFMVAMTGAGMIKYRSSYDEYLPNIGIYFVISSALMTLGAVLCIFRKSLPNLISFICTVSGFTLCMIMLKRFTDRADKSGWTGYGRYQFMPVSDMFTGRILPVILPCAIAAVIAAVQFFSYDASEERRKRKERKKAKDEAPAPSVLGDPD